MKQKLTTFSIPHILFVTGLLLRLILGYLNMGFPSDTACFSVWADRMFTVGAGEFYSPDIFTDYPPGFMYILYVIGALRSLLQLSSYSGAHLLLLKLPAITCDIICAALLYFEATKSLKPSQANMVAGFYLFNPAILLNSSVWGQVDSVYTLAILLLCIYLIRGQLLPSYIIVGLGILIKPQMLVFTPILLVGILDSVFLKDFSLQKLLKNLLQGLLVIFGMLFLCIPFGLERVISQYAATLSSYPYASINAYNFWCLLGLNWVSQDYTVLFLSCKTWGLLVILLIVFFTIFFGFRIKNNPSQYPLLAAFIILTMFVFSVRMHERYMYSGLLLLLLAWIYHPKKSLLVSYFAFTILHFINTAHIFFSYDPANYATNSPVTFLTSLGMVSAILYFYREFANN